MKACKLIVVNDIIYPKVWKAAAIIYFTTALDEALVS
jgi:hypothetical protein